MKLLKILFPICLVLFAWSVSVTMFNMSAEEDVTIMGFPTSYFIIPLLGVNLAILFLDRTPVLMTGLSRVILIWSFVVAFIVLISARSVYLELMRVLLWPTSYFAAYKLCKGNLNYVEKLKYVFIIIFLMGVAYFILGKIAQMEFHMGLMGGSNTVFCVMTVLPFLLLFDNKYIKIAAIAITVVCIVFSNKRSATLTLAIALLPTLNNMMSGFRSTTAKYITIGILGAGAFFLFMYFSDNYLGGRIFDRFESLEEDGGAGRVYIWQYIYNRLMESSFIEWFFGHGHRAVAALGVETAAHNDFLEVIFDYGLLGFPVYISLHWNVAKRMLSLRGMASEKTAAYFFFWTIFVVMSMVSILIVQQRYLIYMAIFMAIVESNFYDSSFHDKKTA